MGVTREIRETVAIASMHPIIVDRFFNTLQPICFPPKTRDRDRNERKRILRLVEVKKKQQTTICVSARLSASESDADDDADDATSGDYRLTHSLTRSGGWPAG